MAAQQPSGTAQFTSWRASSTQSTLCTCTAWIGHDPNRSRTCSGVGTAHCELPITPLVIEHRLHRLVCPCCSTSTCAPLPADVVVSRYGPRLSSLIALLGAAFPLSISKSQGLLQQVLGVEHPRASIVRSLQRVSAALEKPTTAAHRALQQQPVVYVDETGAPAGNADGGNPTGKRGWLWVALSPVVTVFLQGLSRSAAAAIELLGASDP